MRHVVVPVHVAAIVHAYEENARKGDVQAVRELRASLSDCPLKDDRLRVGDIPAERRERVLAYIMSVLERQF